MRKILLLFSTILAFSLLTNTIEPVSAAMESQGTTWWSVEEMLSFYQEVEAEKQAECGDNQDCLMEWNFSMYEKGPKYSALENLLQSQIWITSIDPTTETIKVLFFDEDMMLKHMGIEEKLELEHLYIAWFENRQFQVYNEDYEHFYDGYLEGMHKMYAGISSIDGPNWIPAWEEVELSVAGSNLIDNTQGVITYTVYAENDRFNAQGSIDYSECLRAPDYTYGTECKMMVSGDQWISYFPPREQITEQTNTEEPVIAMTEPGSGSEPETTSEPEPASGNDPDPGPTPEPEPVLEPNPSPAPETTTPEPTELNLKSTEAPVIDPNPSPTSESPAVALSSSEPKPITIKAPETGQGTTNNGDAGLLWPLLIGTTGILLAIWWFIPTETQKIRKKMKKTLDKKNRLR